MENFKARTILLVSSVSYFISLALWSFTGEESLLSDGLRILAFLCLLFGFLAIIRERKAEKREGSKLL
jgi:hypothetical protein